MEEHEAWMSLITILNLVMRWSCPIILASGLMLRCAGATTVIMKATVAHVLRVEFHFKVGVSIGAYRL